MSFTLENLNVFTNAVSSGAATPSSSSTQLQVVKATYSLKNATTEDVTLPPKDVGYTNLLIFCDKSSYSKITQAIELCPPQPFNMTIYDLSGNLLCRYEHTRTNNRSGTVPYSTKGSLSLFANINVDAFTDPSTQQAMIILDNLTGYNSVIEENKHRLMEADANKFSTELTDRFKNMHLVTTANFKTCIPQLSEMFSQVTLSKTYDLKYDITKIFENMLGRTIGATVIQLSKMLQFNEGAEIIGVKSNGYSTFTARTRGRIQFTGTTTDETNTFIVVGYGITHIDEIPVDMPLILTSKEKEVIKNLIELIHINENKPDTEEGRKTFLTNNMKWVMRWLTSDVPYLLKDIKPEFSLVNELTVTYYDNLTQYFSPTWSSAPMPPRPQPPVLAAGHGMLGMRAVSHSGGQLPRYAVSNGGYLEVEHSCALDE